MIRIAINGAKGRMGVTIAGLVADSEETVFACAYDHPGSPHIGSKMSSVVSSDVDAVVVEGSDMLNSSAFDVLIDFSSPESALCALEKCAAGGKPAVVGVTGFSDHQLEKIKALSKDIPIVYSPNMSIGVNLCFRLIQQAAAAIGSVADIDILEMHHRHKKDAPSGTSLRMGEEIASTLGLDMRSAVRFPCTHEDSPRQDNKIGFQVIRGGDNVGEHTAIFAMDGERVEITHRAFNRSAFARGAVCAAIWVYGKPAKLYGMDAVIQDNI